MSTATVETFIDTKDEFSAIAHPTTARQPEPGEINPQSYIDPRATRWVFVPIQAIENLDGQFFGVWRIEPNQFFPVRPVEYEITTEAGNQSRIGRTPFEQVSDLRQVSATESNPKQFVDLFKLSQLENETEQLRVLRVLVNPNSCSKYPFQLKHQCVSCWRDYLSREAPGRIASEFGDNPRLLEAASTSYEQLFNAFESAISQANADKNIALTMLDDKKKGKSALYPADFNNIYHTHSDLPQFRTSTDNSGQMDKLIDVLAKTITPQAATTNGVTVDDVKSIVSEAISGKDLELAERENEIAMLKAQLAEATAPQTPAKAAQPAEEVPSVTNKTGATKK